ncbi:hypothetical protein BGW41_005880 [Actinomortierella wolfii]|nr:hypothetical protein BGW41_005880 [Actinomortierella wolfii]
MTSAKYQLHYFGVHGLAMPIRALLSVGGADWSTKFETFESWANVKSTTPFGTLPVLTVTKESGETLSIPESGAIERYLAKTFGMAGSTEAEEIQVNVVLNLNSFLTLYFLLKVLGSEGEEMKKSFETFKTTRLPNWIAASEKALKNNGSNGHYVGDKITHADISTSTIMDLLLPADGVDAILNEKTAPNMFACKRKVDSHPQYLAYRKSEEFAKLSEAFQGFVSKKFPFDMSKAHIVA